MTETGAKSNTEHITQCNDELYRYCESLYVYFTKVRRKFMVFHLTKERLNLSNFSDFIPISFIFYQTTKQPHTKRRYLNLTNSGKTEKKIFPNEKKRKEKNFTQIDMSEILIPLE